MKSVLGGTKPLTDRMRPAGRWLDIAGIDNADIEAQLSGMLVAIKQLSIETDFSLR